MDAALESNVIWVARRLREVDITVAFTGTGISMASGIPDFRGGDGIWETELNPTSLHRDRFANGPTGFWCDCVHLQERIFPDGVELNPGYEVLPALESRGVLDAVVTQNTDDLHRGTGSDRIIELHDNVVEVACKDCGT